MVTSPRWMGRCFGIRVSISAMELGGRSDFGRFCWIPFVGWSILEVMPFMTTAIYTQAAGEGVFIGPFLCDEGITRRSLWLQCNTL